MKRAVILTSSTQIAIQVIGLATGIIVARWLGPDGRGELAAVINWATMLVYIGNLGLPVAFTYASANLPHLRHQLLGNGFLVAIIQWVVLGLIGSLLLPMVLKQHGSSLAHLAVLYLWAYLPLNILTLYAIAIQQGAGQYARYNAVRFSIPVGYAVLLAVAWFVGQINVETVVLVNILSNGLTLVFALVLVVPPLLRLARGSADSLLNFASFKTNLRYGLSAQIGNLQPFSGLQIDILALTLLSTTSELGLYVAAMAGANVLKAQAYALGQVVFPEVTKQKNRSEQWRIIRRFMLIALTGGVAAFIVVMFAAKPLLNLIYGEAFTPAAQMLQILVAAGGVGAVYRIFADGLRGMGLPGIATRAELIGLLVGGTALVIQIPIWGGKGAAIATFLASITSLTAAAWFAYKDKNIRHKNTRNQIGTRED